MRRFLTAADDVGKDCPQRQNCSICESYPFSNNIKLLYFVWVNLYLMHRNFNIHTTFLAGNDVAPFEVTPNELLRKWRHVVLWLRYSQNVCSNVELRTFISKFNLFFNFFVQKLDHTRITQQFYDLKSRFRFFFKKD